MIKFIRAIKKKKKMKKKRRLVILLLIVNLMKNDFRIVYRKIHENGHADNVL